MKKDRKYNWWTDPKNKEEVERISWWNHSENKETIPFPISIINDGDYWCAAANDDTEKLLGDRLTSASQGKTKEKAIEEFFMLIRFRHEYEVSRAMEYKRWVPFIKGDWSKIGGKWIVIFGIQFHFRKGKVQYGWYIPFTNVNILVTNYWSIYRKYMKKRKEMREKNNSSI